jgi:hypothetical protein
MAPILDTLLLPTGTLTGFFLLCQAHSGDLLVSFSCSLRRTTLLDSLNEEVMADIKHILLPLKLWNGFA